jgi:hypothetical protein
MVGILLTTQPPSFSRLSRQCGILDFSQPYRLPQPITEIALLYDRVKEDEMGRTCIKHGGEDEYL